MKRALRFRAASAVRAAPSVGGVAISVRLHARASTNQRPSSSNR